VLKTLLLEKKREGGREGYECYINIIVGTLGIKDGQIVGIGLRLGELYGQGCRVLASLLAVICLGILFFFLAIVLLFFLYLLLPFSLTPFWRRYIV